MKLSLILCSRNDEYMGNSRWRLETTLNYVAERVAELGRLEDVEVIVADWGSEVPLREVVRLEPPAARIVRFVTIPPALAQQHQGDSPFPEVLALNAAARRARGAYIGRIDQDTLVGTRFLRWMFEIADAPQTLFFANRRNIPYRFVVGSPSLQNVTRFVRFFGSRLPAWRKNPATGHLFWTSYVGIWLAHRTLWQESGGYDERLIYYNWMETDMIRRLRQKYPLVKLDEDFYHLEHYHPRKAWFTRPHDRQNAVIDPAATSPVMHPNGGAWGLAQYELTPQTVSTAAATASGSTASPSGIAGFAVACVGVAAAMLADRIAIAWMVQRDVWSHRFRRVRDEWTQQPAGSRTQALLQLWKASGLRARLRRVLGVEWLRARLTTLLASVRALGAARRLRLQVALWRSPEVHRLAAADRDRLVTFRQEFGSAIGRALNDGCGKRALVVSSECPTVEGTLCIIKALQLAGLNVTVLLEDEREALRPFYELAGVTRVHLWSEFLTSLDCSREAANVVARSGSIDAVMQYSRETACGLA